MVSDVLSGSDPVCVCSLLELLEHVKLLIVLLVLEDFKCHLSTFEDKSQKPRNLF